MIFHLFCPELNCLGNVFAGNQVGAHQLGDCSALVSGSPFDTSSGPKPPGPPGLPVGWHNHWSVVRGLHSCPTMASQNPEYFAGLDTNATAEARVFQKLILFFVCLFATLWLVGCSPRDQQQAKDVADRQAIVGIWVGGDTNRTFGIARISSDGTYSTSNRIVARSSISGWVAAGKWSITNGGLTITNLEISYSNWGKQRQIDTVQHARILRITGQELVFAANEDGLELTNIMHRIK